MTETMWKLVGRDGQEVTDPDDAVVRSVTEEGVEYVEVRCVKCSAWLDSYEADGDLDHPVCRSGCVSSTRCEECGGALDEDEAMSDDLGRLIHPFAHGCPKKEEP